MTDFHKLTCPQCGNRDDSTACRFCGISKLERTTQPPPAEAYYDIFEEIKSATDVFYETEDKEVDPRWDEDHHLDDPRHGQAEGINRENRGRE